MHVLTDLSFFLTTKTSAPHGDRLRRMKLLFANSCI
jgi:hypothetical protein